MRLLFPPVRATGPTGTGDGTDDGTDDALDPAELEALVAREPRPAPPDRPWVLANMVSTLDGATDVGGVSGGLGGPADRVLFPILRSMADVVLVGAGTVRAERYGPVQLADALQARRVARGQAPLPRLAIVSSRLDLDPSTELFAAPTSRPLVITIEDAPADRRDALAAVADVLVAGTAAVDLPDALRRLRRDHAATVVLTEGGPTLIGTLAAAGLVDELCWTVANALAGGESPRLAHGPVVDPLRRLALRRVLEADGTLLLGYARDD